jgi:CHAT domain-containing protein
MKQGQLESAREATDRASQRFPSEQSIWHWRFKVLKAEILLRQGSRQESLELLKEEPPASMLDADLAVRRKIVQGVANAWDRQPSDADHFLAEADSLARAHHPELLGDLALAKGLVSFLANDWASAATSYRNALQLSLNPQDQYAQSLALGGLGLVATKQERYDEAIDWDEASLRLARSLNVQSSLAFILGNMAWAYRSLGDFDNALSFYEQAEEAATRDGIVDQQIYWLTGTSTVFYQQHNYKGAKEVLTRGLDLARSQGNKRTLTEYLNDLAEIDVETGQIESAEKNYEEAAGMEQNSLDQSELASSQLLRGRIDAEKHDYAKAEGSFRRVAADPKTVSSLKWEAEARLAGVYAGMGRPAEADAEFRRSVAMIESTRATVKKEDLRISFLSSAISFYDDYIDFLFSQHRTDEALQVAELSRAQTLAEGLATTPQAVRVSANLHPELLARKLNATILFYWLGERHSYLWVITPLKTACLPLPAAPQIDPAVKAYRDGVAASKDVAETEQAAGEKLYTMLVEPAQKLIPPDSRVILLPDGGLYSLNFETLIVPSPKPHFWIEDVSLTTAGSLSLLASGASRPLPKQKNLLLVGDALEAAKEFQRLPQAEDEMQIVERYFPDSNRTVLKGGQATPSAYLGSNPERYAYLHFVTHGTASRTRPLESAVILSKEPASDGYKLYARDIVTRHLNAELVTISACNGSGNRAYSGEGLVGLSWAFLRAGAHNVIGALWEVSNAPSTSQLMDAFYHGLSQGKDPASALRAAKLSLLHSDGVFKKPYYWAPFQLYAGS